MTSTKPNRRTGDGPRVSVAELHERLTAAVASIETGEQWQAWLDFAHRLHTYSFNNLILIWAQCPDATAVASYRTWQGLDRQVRRGEKAIRVLAPMTRRRPVVDQQDQPVLKPDGTPVQRQQLLGFKPVAVFDIAQTDGPPPPQPPAPVLLAGEAPAGLWDALVGEVSERGYRLLRGPVDRLGGANGVTKITEREVWVRDDVDDAQAVKTLTHELAHVMLHTNPDQPTGCAGVREVEAESVAHLVMAVHGLDTGAYTFPYVAVWAQPVAAAEHKLVTEVITRTGTRVIQTAHTILNAIPPVAEPDPAAAALTARVTASADRGRELRDQAAGVVLPVVERDTLLGVIGDSQDYFARQVEASWVPDYLADRNLVRAIASHQVGYAPEGWTALTDHLRILGYTDAHIEAAGMATRARTGNLIDRFRDRLTIPLRDAQGELIGFTGRRAPDVDDPRVPKYLNTPTTSLFHKHEILYGLTEHTPQVTAGATPVVCEGPLDAIAIDLNGHDQHRDWVGVAAIGTAFTDDHAHRLLDVTSGGPILLGFDGDHAGWSATEAAWRKITDPGPADVRVVVLPDGSDPAALHAVDPWALTRTLLDAPPAASVIAGRHIHQAGVDGHIAGEVAAYRSLCTLVNRVPVDGRAEFLLDLAQRLHLDPATAATLTAQQNPTIVMDAITARAQHLKATLNGPVDPRVDQQPPVHRADVPSLGAR